MLERIFTLEEERVPAKNARGWQIERLKEASPGRNAKRLREEFEAGGLMA